jgi:hypothetical protein
MKSIAPQIQPITRDEFLNWSSCKKVIVHEHARRFGAIAPNGAPELFALSWRSETIEPIVAIGSCSESWIGIDLRIACVSDDNRIVVSLGLGSNVLNIRCFADRSVILCETDALIFNRDYSLRCVRPLSDLPDDVFEENGMLVVAFDSGRRERLD